MGAVSCFQRTLRSAGRPDSRLPNAIRAPRVPRASTSVTGPLPVTSELTSTAVQPWCAQPRAARVPGSTRGAPRKVSARSFHQCRCAARTLNGAQRLFTTRT